MSLDWTLPTPAMLYRPDAADARADAREAACDDYLAWLRGGHRTDAQAALARREEATTAHNAVVHREGRFQQAWMHPDPVRFAFLLGLAPAEAPRRAA